VFVISGVITPLIGASHNGQIDIVRELIEAGANMNHTNEVTKPPNPEMYSENEMRLTFIYEC
jgi:ankyrin repeat protein